MNDEAWKDFRETVRQDISDALDRIRKLEMNSAINDERDKNLAEKMDNLHKFFEKHDKEEMFKYGQMNNTLSDLKNIAYIATGMAIILGFVGIDNVKAFFVG